ncbi:MAG: NnrU family protein [Rhizobiaceae bacterium]
MLTLVIGLILFLGIHSLRIFAPAFRESQIAARGEGAWKGIYTIISIAGLAMMVWGFGQARLTAPLLYESPVFMRHINATLMLIAFIVLMSGYFPSGKIRAAVRHPMVTATKIWAFGHLLANGDLASVLLFGSFLVWGVLTRISYKRRGDLGATVAGPFANDLMPVVAGAVLYGLFVWKLHVWLIGVPVL